MPERDEPRVGRRGFFRDVLARVARPLAGGPDPPASPRQSLRLLRPPGALAETAFAEACQRCGKCVEVCPAYAIFPVADAAGVDASIEGTPVIDPSAAACVVCSDLACTHACPSGALLPLARPDEIRMGRAVVHSDLCVRSAGEACTECVDKCPIGGAISFPDEGPPQVWDACVGCGVCELYCPTAPKAIRVEPR